MHGKLLCAPRQIMQIVGTLLFSMKIFRKKSAARKVWTRFRTHQISHLGFQSDDDDDMNGKKENEIAEKGKFGEKFSSLKPISHFRRSKELYVRKWDQGLS